MGISQKELSALTGIDQSDISKIERGTANPSVSTLERIAAALGGRLTIQIEIPATAERGGYTMDIFVPYEKLSKKKKWELDLKRRNTWSISPVTRN